MLPRSFTPEEQEERYTRLLTCSLLALGEFATLLPEKELPSVQDVLSSIVAEAKFWKLAKNKSPQVIYGNGNGVWEMRDCAFRENKTTDTLKLH